MAELELLKHFGAGGNAGRAAELSARGSEAITASPASEPVLPKAFRLTSRMARFRLRLLPRRPRQR